MAGIFPSGDKRNHNVQRIKRIVWFFASAWSTQAVLIFLSLFLLGSYTKAEEMPATCDENCPAPFVANQFWTTEYGPAAANIVLTPTNFLSCPSSDYALCYYSGPDSTPTGPNGKKLPKLPCKVSSKDPDMADCRCYAESGESYVDIHAIRNTEAYIETIRQCGLNGEKCRNMASVAVEKIDEQPGAYAGCMTASCTFERNKNGERTGFANCKCPIYSGPYQIGQQNGSCNAGSGNVWSAAYAPPSE